MADHEITKFFSNEGTRNDVRMRVVNRMAEEDPRTGTGNDSSRYLYYVETLNDGNRVYLKRPANLHNGFDFVWVTDGNGWHSARRNLKETFDIMEHIYNIDDLEKGAFDRLFC